MEIRELETEAARRRAVPIVQQLWRDKDADEIVAWTGADDYHLFGCFAAADLVGVASVLVRDHLHHARIGWLYDLVVDEPRRGEGFGSALVDHVEDWADERDCDAVALASPLDREGTHAFYEGLDYEKWGYVVEKEL